MSLSKTSFPMLSTVSTQEDRPFLSKNVDWDINKQNWGLVPDGQTTPKIYPSDCVAV